MSPRSSMSEYRPGVTSPHTPYLPQRALFTLRLAPLLLAQPPLPSCLPLTRPVSTRSLRHSCPPPPPPPPRNIPLTWRLSSDSSLRAHSISLCRARHVVFLSHYPGPSCLRCSPSPLFSSPFPLIVYPPDDALPDSLYLRSCSSLPSSGISECFGNLVRAFLPRLSYVGSRLFPFLSLPGVSAILLYIYKHLSFFFLVIYLLHSLRIFS